LFLIKHFANNCRQIFTRSDVQSNAKPINNTVLFFFFVKFATNNQMSQSARFWFSHTN